MAHLKPSTKYDTMVVPARPASFARLFLGEHRWYPIRVAKKTPARFLAIYVTHPISAITHAAQILSIEPYVAARSDYTTHGKSIIVLSPSLIVLSPVTRLGSVRVQAVQSLRYTTMAELQQARTLDDLWVK